MTYGPDHTEDHCDKCQELVGRANLHRVHFLYKDMNDKSHEDLGEGYRQYYICKDCQAIEDSIEANKIRQNREDYF